MNVKMMEAISNNNFKIGIINESINYLSTRTMNKLIEHINFGDATDINITDKKVKKVIMLSFISFRSGTEIDIQMVTKQYYDNNFN